MSEDSKITTTEQVKNMNLNPTGIGGFGDNPQNRNNGGRYPRTESFTYWFNYFKGLSMDDFKLWLSVTPDTERTVASEMAYKRMKNALDNLRDFQEVANRSEGTPQRHDYQDDKVITAVKVEIVG